MHAFWSLLYCSSSGGRGNQSAKNTCLIRNVALSESIKFAAEPQCKFQCMLRLSLLREAVLDCECSEWEGGKLTWMHCDVSLLVLVTVAMHVLKSECCLVTCVCAYCNCLKSCKTVKLLHAYVLLSTMPRNRTLVFAAAAALPVETKNTLRTFNAANQQSVGLNILLRLLLPSSHFVYSAFARNHLLGITWEVVNCCAMLVCKYAVLLVAK